MEVKVIAKTNDMLNTIYTAARTCYSKLTPLEIFEKDIDDAKKIELLSKITSSGHTSVCEHGSFTFVIQGVSRSLLAQLTRHRIASYSVQSLRYVDFSKLIDETASREELVKDLCVIPNNVLENKKLLKDFVDSSYNSIIAYKDLVDSGIAPEDARQLLPMSFKTNIVCTFNIRSLMNFMGLRLCNRAQAEIRELAFKMRHAVMLEEVWLKDYLLPLCIKNGKCKENNPCGKKVDY